MRGTSATYYDHEISHAHGGGGFGGARDDCGGGLRRQRREAAEAHARDGVGTGASAPARRDRGHDGEDPLALFPAGALGMFAIDMHAFYASESTGPTAAKVAEKYFPIGAEAGFSPSRDLDRVTAGVYSMQGADGLATLVGRFDAAKIQKLADSKTQLHGGGLLVASQYAGRTLYTVADVGFTIVSPHLVLGGTKTTINARSIACATASSRTTRPRGCCRRWLRRASRSPWRSTRKAFRSRRSLGASRSRERTV